MLSHRVVFLFFFIIRQPTRSTLFPYTTLFRSVTLETQRLLLEPVSTSHADGLHAAVGMRRAHGFEDRKSTRLNSSHANISYAVFCLKKKKKNKNIHCIGNQSMHHEIRIESYDR